MRNKALIFVIIVVVVGVMGVALIFSNKNTNVENIEKKADLIRVSNPQPEQVISSPLTVEGQARGSWFFEATFHIVLVDENGDQIASTNASTNEDWTTEDFISFFAELTFIKPQTATGILIFSKANPSGLPENADELRVLVVF